MPSKAACQPVNMVTMVVMKYAEQSCSAAAVNIKQQLLLALTLHYLEKKNSKKNVFYFYN